MMPLPMLRATVLRERCQPSDLAAFGNIYLRSLQAGKGDYLYLVAKAKVAAARPYIEALAELDKWRGQEEALKVINIVRQRWVIPISKISSCRPHLRQNETPRQRRPIGSMMSVQPRMANR
ncbi:hypothetical protein [Massilia haematophila]|uniref:Uncharacterized protein n=1 Tax=Massilia haematophila TaxID=457923 RepID=A0ABV7PT30_9BURK